MGKIWGPICRALGFQMTPWVAIFILFAYCKFMEQGHSHHEFYIMMLIAAATNSNVEATNHAFWFLTAHLCRHVKQIQLPEQLAGAVNGIWEWSEIAILGNA